MNADADSTPSSAIDPALLEILVCPLTRSKLRLEGDELVAELPTGAGLRYPIRNGVPVLLAEEAKLPTGIADLAAFKQKYAEHIPA
ncbi:Trm112 family protein [Phycisphaerales bacterium AB-hyl4]|uniref:Trm112 family protein n=1 Tax=Natronomicrosphaera hydrolytica TaxID=3242702 RepID=A0ABV4U8X6_9BACT